MLFVGQCPISFYGKSAYVGFSIMVVVNGYFRSGTSVIWSILRSSNENYRVYYEPCHEKLPSLVQGGRPGSVHKIHEYSLWDEYYKFDKVGCIKDFHPSLGKPFPVDLEKTLEYMNFLGDDKPTILQVNRWHPVLQGLAGSGHDVCQVVRDPISISGSIMTYYRKKSLPLVGFLKEVVVSRVAWSRPFSIGRQYKAIIDNNLYGEFLGGVKRPENFEEMVHYVWLWSNLPLLSSPGIRVILHHDIVFCPSAVQEVFKEIGVSFDFDGKIKEGKVVSVSPFLDAKTIDIFSKLGVLDLYERLLVRIGVEGLK